MRCDECKFYSFPGSECRIAPPVFVAGFQGGQFPVISLDGWCGKWERDQGLRDAISYLNKATSNDFISAYGVEEAQKAANEAIATISKRKSQ